MRVPIFQQPSYVASHCQGMKSQFDDDGGGCEQAVTAYYVGKGPPRLVYENSFFNGLAHLKVRARLETLNNFSKTRRSATKARQTEQGLCVRPWGKPDQPLPDGRYLYVVTPKGSLYVDWQRHAVSHSNVLSGRPVQCAGWLEVRNQHVVTIDNSSGHYMPRDQMLSRTVRGLQQRDLLRPDCKIICWGSSLGAAPACCLATGNRLQLSDRPEPVRQVSVIAPVPWLHKLIFFPLLGLCVGLLGAIVRQEVMQPETF